MKDRFLIIISLVWIVFGSCKPFNYLSVEIAEPAKQDLSGDIQSLLLVNRAVDRYFTDDPSDSVQLRFFKARFSVDTVIYDTKAADTLVQALGNLLFESGRFDIVIPEDRFLMKDTVSFGTNPMNWDEAEKYTGIFNTDAVLSLDHFRTGILTQYYQAPAFDIITGQPFMENIAQMEISYVALFRVYFPGNRELIMSFLISDTLQWEDGDSNLKKLFQRFTFVKKGLIEAGIDAALKLSDEIAPAWKPVQRVCFAKGNPVLRETWSLVEDNNWQTAIEIWMELLEGNTSKRLRSKLQFNLALANEMLGNLPEAVYWGVESYKTIYRPVTYNYLNILNKRKLPYTKPDENN